MVTIKQIQQRLNCLGYGKLDEDGIDGKNTRAALKKFQKDNDLVADGIAGKETVGKLFPTLVVPVKPKILTVSQMISEYGVAGDIKNHVIVKLPIKMWLAWDTRVPITSFSCHKKIETRIKNALDEVFWHYGEQEMRRLGLDLWGGCFNHRPKRGLEKKYNDAIKAKNYALAATYLSSHSWAVSFDWNPLKNQLKTKWVDAQFSKPAYKAMIEIMYKHGFLNYGIEKNFDAMHWEISANI